MTNRAGDERWPAEVPASLAELPEGMERWITEMHTPYTGHLYAVRKTFFKGSSLFQDIEVVELAHFGKTLFLDGKVQSSEDSEWIYHELLVHPVMVAHERPERVLIIGGGEGATAREVLKHSTVKAVDMVDIDVMVYEVCKRYMPELNAGAFEDPRFSLVVADGRAFVEALSERGRKIYDVVIVDATDPLEGGPAYLLYTKEFYRVIRDILKPGGLMITQAEDVCVLEDLSLATVSIYRTVRAVFPIARYYARWVPSFDSEWAFVIGSTGPDPASLGAGEVAKRLEERRVGGLRYYTPELHPTLFVLPKYLSELLERHSTARVIRDGEPLFIYSEKDRRR